MYTRPAAFPIGNSVPAICFKAEDSDTMLRTPFEDASAYRTVTIAYQTDVMLWCIAESRRNRVGSVGKGTLRSDRASSPSRRTLNFYSVTRRGSPAASVPGLI